MDKLLSEIRNCSVCKDFLPNIPRPIIQASSVSKIVIIGQAPGQKVQNSGIPWDDASGNNLREWLGVDKETFYNDKIFALIPMGFCFPGNGKSGDLPPRPECAPLWHQQVLESMPEIKLTLLIGQHAQKYYLKNNVKASLTETVKNYQEYLANYIPLPHPSPRNNIWQKKNTWFKENLIQVLQEKVVSVIDCNPLSTTDSII
ncbi:uracil-DNA glycosylase family protein [Flavobacterium sp. Root186]|uniref:uracil-DNA glycosylase family protein n=1 Tax=Flavobacterium sp. Root186 TaxID=1736485 RepID=UPI0006FEC143|nr:uracil-DNA glycosylase family protein [Flavobacterium sp. Root186]KRB59909.1 IclR family transcriptional regulator [Flavobacterium sp. Root186]